MKQETRLVCFLSKDGTITRLKHYIAQSMVDRGAGHFTTKSKYKAAVKKANAGKLRIIK